MQGAVTILGWSCPKYEDFNLGKKTRNLILRKLTMQCRQLDLKKFCIYENYETFSAFAFLEIVIILLVSVNIDNWYAHFNNWAAQ